MNDQGLIHFDFQFPLVDLQLLWILDLWVFQLFELHDGLEDSLEIQLCELLGLHAGDGLDEIVESGIGCSIVKNRVLDLETILERQQFRVFDWEFNEASDKAADLEYLAQL